MIVRLLHRITDAAVSQRGKFIVLALWGLVTVALILFAPKLASFYDNNASQQIPATADSQVAQRLLQHAFPSNNNTPAIIVFYDGRGLSISDRRVIKRISDWLGSQQKPAEVAGVVSVFTVPQAASQLISRDGTTMTAIVSLKGSTQSNSVHAIRTYLQQVTAQTSLQTYLTGPAGILTDVTQVFSAVDLPLLLTTISLVFVLLIVLYRSPLLAIIPLLTVGFAMQDVNALLAFGAQARLFSVGQMSTSIATVLLFGAGTDYSIFIASRYREELQRIPDKHEAMRQTMRAVGEAITSSAGTVILAMLTLILAILGLYSSLGPTLAIAIGVMLIAGLTLVPALIVCFGRIAYWPLIPRYQASIGTVVSARLQGFWGWLGQWTVRHRIVAVLSSVIFLIILALGNIGSQPSFNFLTSFRVATDSTRGYSTLQQHFAAGTLAPTAVLIQFHGSSPDPYAHLVQLDAVTSALQQVPGVATVTGPTRPGGSPPDVNLTTLQANIASLRAGNTHLPFPLLSAYFSSTQYVSTVSPTVQLSIAFQDDPYSLPAINRIATLRSTLTQALDTNHLGPGAATSATFHFSGQTAQLFDTLGYNQHDTYLIVPLVLVLVFIVLALLLRSLIAPLYLLVAVTLNFLAALGICSFYFQRILGEDGFNYAIPLYAFIFLVALGADYTIFLMSRVREETDRYGFQKGVPLAVSHTGGVITSAGVILAGTFLVLTSLPLTILYQLGVCVAVGILLDTFVVRGLLIPGLVSLLGAWNWWPQKISPSSKNEQQQAPADVVDVSSHL